MVMPEYYTYGEYYIIKATGNNIVNQKFPDTKWKVFLNNKEIASRNSLSDSTDFIDNQII